jgi:hypothetical protein
MKWMAFFYFFILYVQAQCINNCSSIGVCELDQCTCPFIDPRTGIRWGAPPNRDCSVYGYQAYGIGLTSFQISWALLSLFGLCLMVI